MKKILNYVTAATIAAAGLSVATASPALAAVGGCSPSSNPTVVVCVNHGHDGARTRGDFYLNRTPDWSTYKYSEHFVVNGREEASSRGGTLTVTGRYCCTYTTRVSGTRIKNRVKIWTQSNTLHMYVDSPQITVP